MKLSSTTVMCGPNLTSICSAFSEMKHENTQRDGQMQHTAYMTRFVHTLMSMFPVSCVRVDKQKYPSFLKSDETERHTDTQHEAAR
jgi:hypothetical protein